MSWQYTPYTAVLVLATIVGVVTTALTWRRRADVAARWAAYTNAAISLWGATHLLTVSSTVYEVKAAALLAGLLAISTTSTAAFGYAVCFTGRQEWLTRRRIAALVSFPTAVALVLATNSTHELVVAGSQLDQGGAFDQLTYEPGPFWYLIGVGNYGLPLAGLGLLVKMFQNVRNVYRKITFVVILAFSSLIAISVFSFTRESPFPHFLLIPSAYLFVSLLLLLAMTSVRFVRAIPIDWALARLGFGSSTVVPLARDYVVEEVDNGIVVLDADGHVADVNSMGKLMIGADRPLGKHISETAQFDRMVDGNGIEALLEHGDVDGFETEVWVDPPDVDGNRCYHVRITTIEQRGRRAGIVILLHDVTDRKRREEELRDRKEELTAQKENLQRQKRALVRQNERLESQARKLEHQNERLDDFASIVSHDLRNPLNVADGYLEMIKTDARNGDPTDPDTVQEVVHSTDRMERIIQDALTMARQGKAITETEPTDVAAVATEAWEQVGTGGATLEVDLTTDAGDPLVVEADPSRLQTVFENLFRNSVEHAAEDDATLTITVRRTSADCICVADDGAGIPPARREEVLERGYTTNDDGTGLGLSIVQDVVKAHGWTLTVGESEAGGARFEICDVEVVSDGDEDDLAALGDDVSTMLDGGVELDAGQ